MHDKLKPCPKCGSDMNPAFNVSNGWIMCCSECNYEAVSYMSKEDCFHVHKESIKSETTNTSTDLPDPKTPFHLADLAFLGAMCENYQDGIRGDRTANGWMTMEWDTEQHMKCTGAILRHLLGYYTDTDDNERLQHLAAIACNANIIWHHEGKR